MRLFVFGAGASFGSQGAGPANPSAPLTNDLFIRQDPNLVRHLGFGETAFEEYRLEIAQFGNDLEKWLTNRWESISEKKQEDTKNALRVDFGRIAFYLHRLFLTTSRFPGDDLYGKLIDKLSKKDDKQYGFINFNYDLLLDRAYQNRIGVQFDADLSVYTKHRYIKPHGSVNWYLRLRDSDSAMSASDTGANLELRYSRAISQMFRTEPLAMKGSHGSMVVMNPLSDGQYNEAFIGDRTNFNGHFFYPFMLLPLSSKMYNHIVDFEELLIVPAKELSAQANEVYLIGYRAQDEIIHDIFEMVRPETVLNVVSIDEQSAQEIRDRVIGWQPNFRRGSLHPGFRQFVEQF